MADRATVKDYDNVFDPVVYLQTYYEDISTQQDLKLKIFQGLHEVFVNGGLHGTRLLDIGTGPSICSVISAVPHFDEIYLSDYSDRNISSLRKWMNGSADHSFETFFEYFLKLEGKELHWSSREKEFRRKVKAILKCDLLQSQILSDADIGPVDVITSCLCLEAAANDIACYGEICKKIAALLKDDGYVVLAGVLQETFYTLGANRFYALYIKKEDLVKAWEDAGFSIVGWREEKSSPNEENQFSDYESGFVLVAKKDRK